MNDLTLLLPDKTKIATLSITAAPTKYSEILQRVICLMFLTNSGITIDGFPIYQIIGSGNSMTVDALGAKLGAVASFIKDKLNEDEYCISQLSISVEAEDSSVKLIIDITSADNEQGTEVLYI